jgi:uncharacterized protein (DUF1810 family)
MHGLGHSSTAQFYGISSLGEAKAYLSHPLLSQRLLLCTEIVLKSSARSLHAIFGSPDDMKFRSSMTLFAAASADDNNVFQQAIIHWCEGIKDEKTLELV